MQIKNDISTTKLPFLRDDSARVPFAVIGIFFVILSTLVSLNLTRMDIKMAKTMSSNLEISAPDQALAYAKADLARALNYAGMEALKNLGETPVIKPDNTSEYYKGTNGDPYKFNMNWARAMTNYTFDHVHGIKLQLRYFHIQRIFSERGLSRFLGHNNLHTNKNETQQDYTPAAI